MNKTLSRRLVELAHQLQASGDSLDVAAATWILHHEKEDRQTSRRRTPRIIVPRQGGHVPVRLKCGAVGYVPARLVQEALEDLEE